MTPKWFDIMPPIPLDHGVPVIVRSTFNQRVVYAEAFGRVIFTEMGLVNALLAMDPDGVVIDTGMVHAKSKDCVVNLDSSLGLAHAVKWLHRRDKVRAGPFLELWVRSSHRGQDRLNLARAIRAAWDTNNQPQENP